MEETVFSAEQAEVILFKALYEEGQGCKPFPDDSSITGDISVGVLEVANTDSFERINLDNLNFLGDVHLLAMWPKFNLNLQYSRIDGDLMVEQTEIGQLDLRNTEVYGSIVFYDSPPPELIICRQNQAERLHLIFPTTHLIVKGLLSDEHDDFLPYSLPGSLTHFDKSIG